MLGLATPTDDAWIEAAIADVPSLLCDHAHCEMKAASNAMSLAVRHGDRPELVQALVALAEEELAHFRRVHQILIERGIPLGSPPVDPYAATLRRAAHDLGQFRSPLVDRLLIGALIEARSCERFRLLSERAPEPELRALYHELLASEAGHYRVFVDLAVREGAREGIDEDTVRARLRALAAAEGAIVAQLVVEDDRATVHG
ncbi:MAG: tRNA-(ms[2]io[6]A)-hydroxylase [Deltaproteobacteria bacterium]|nr:tRNA-(ms[2]io[6]A)-hydroxylase [Deltaproteobacteria bacterium]